MTLILFLTIDASGGYSNSGHAPHLELYHLIFVVMKHVFLCTEHQNRKKKKKSTADCLLRNGAWAGRMHQEKSMFL